MSLITEKTQKQIDLDAKDYGIIASANGLHYAACSLAQAAQAHAALPVDRALDVLNDNPALSLETMQALNEIGTCINAWLDRVGYPEFATRCPVGPPRSDVEFDGTQFVAVVVPPAEPEN